MEFKYFSRNGEILPIGEAAVPLSDIAYSYGFGVYETIRVEHGAPYFLGDHLERLLGSAQIIGLRHPFESSFIKKSIEDLIEKNAVSICNLKVLLVGGESPTLYMQCLNPLFPDRKLYSEGASCVTYEYERAFPHAKSLNMLQSYLAYRKAKEAGAYDALFINMKGDITEGTRTNILGIKGRTIISPPENEILLGVTRKHVLDVAGQVGYDVKVADMPLSTIDDYENVFLTSTSSKIMPIRIIDERGLNAPSPSLRELMAAFDAYLDNDAKIS